MHLKNMLQETKQLTKIRYNLKDLQATTEANNKF